MNLPQANKLKLLSYSRVQTQLAIFTLFLGISLLLPAVIHNQLFTGPVINALLFLSVSSLGIEQAILIGLLPSTVAVTRGLLPIALAPMVPFIMLANTILILIFAKIKDFNEWWAIGIASLLKAGFLSFVSYLIMPNLLSTTLTDQLQAGMSWLQFMTALLGGLLYWLVYNYFFNSDSSKLD